MVYQWRQGAHITVNAQKAGERIFEYLPKKLGHGPKAKDVLEDAKAKSSPLHNAFAWNNTKAAEKWRLQQANQILCSIITVEVEILDQDETKSRIVHNVRACFPVNRNKTFGRTFESTSEIMANVVSEDDLKNQLLLDILSQINRSCDNARKLFPKEFKRTLAALKLDSAEIVKFTSKTKCGTAKRGQSRQVGPRRVKA